MKAFRIVLWALVALAAIGLGLLLVRQSQPEPSEPIQMQVNFGGPFTLVGSDGQPFSSSKLNGKPYVIFFGFTHCPDVCPTTLARLAKLRRQLGKGDDAFNIVFVSVDSERDGPAEVGAYSKLFGTPVIGLTGSPAQIEHVKKSYGIFSSKVAQVDGDYSVDHTATTLLMDKAGKFVATIAPEEPDNMALDKLRRIVG